MDKDDTPPKTAPSQDSRPAPKAENSDRPTGKQDDTPVRYTDWASI